MEAERLVITPLYEVIPPAHEDFDRFGGFLAEALSGLGRKQHKFPECLGVTFEGAHSLWDELLLVCYDVLGVLRHQNPHTGQSHGTM